MISLPPAAFFATVPTWRAWHFDLPLKPSARRETYVRVLLPPSVDPGSGGTYPDLRVVDDRELEVPYALDAERPPADGDERSVQVSDVGFVTHAFTEATLDLGTSGAVHDAIKLKTSEATFFVPVEIASSDDRRTWRTLRRDAMIYRVSQDGSEDTMVRYPSSRARWLRVRVLEPRHPFDLQGASIIGADRVPPEHVVRLRVDALPQPSEDPNEETWLFDGRGRRISVLAVAFDAKQATFERNVRIQASDDGEHWYEAGSGKIARFATGEPAVRIPFGETYARAFRVVVDNRDDRPVSGLAPRLYGRQRFLIFRADPKRRYRLLWGNPTAAAPEYDLRAKLDHEDWYATPLDVVEAIRPARLHSVTDALSGPLIFSGALLACCVVLGALTLRVLRE